MDKGGGKDVQSSQWRCLSDNFRLRPHIFPEWNAFMSVKESKLNSVVSTSVYWSCQSGETCPVWSCLESLSLPILLWSRFPGRHIETGVGFFFIGCEYHCLIKKLLWSYGRAEQNYVGKTGLNPGRKKAEWGEAM